MPITMQLNTTAIFQCGVIIVDIYRIVCHTYGRSAVNVLNRFLENGAALVLARSSKASEMDKQLAPKRKVPHK